MKSCCGFMFVRTAFFHSMVCAKSKGETFMQKLEDPKKQLEICQIQKNSGNFAKPKKQFKTLNYYAQNISDTENRIWPNFKPLEV